MSTTEQAKKDVWDGDEYLNRPGARETGRTNGQTNIPAGLVAAGTPASSFKELDVLEVGAGPGTVTIHLAPQFRSVHALEPSAGMLRTLEKIVEAPNATYSMHNLTPESGKQFAAGEALQSPTAADPARSIKPPVAQFDAAVSTLVVHHVDDFGPFFEGVKSVLKPGGVFVALEFTFAPDGTDLSKKYHLEKAATMTPVSDNEAPLADGNHFRTSYTIETLGGLFKKYGFVDVGGVETTGVEAFGSGPEGPQHVPTIAVYGRKPL